jgi:hypothetical protein
MEGSEPPDEFAAVDWNDPASGKSLMQSGHCPGVIILVEDRKQDY